MNNLTEKEIELLQRIHTWKHNSIVNGVTIKQIKEIYTKPFFVVDVGCGDGFYGKLLRGLFDVIHLRGIEKNRRYLDKFHLRPLYDEILEEDIKDVISELEGDLIIFGDVLEHLEKDDCMSVVKLAISNFKYILINAPIGFQEQPHEYPEEWHRCGLDRTDFDKFKIIEYNEYPEEKMFNLLLKGDS